MSLNPYLYFNGQSEEAFQFYEKRVGGKITFMMRYEGSPMAGQTPPGTPIKSCTLGSPWATAYWKAVMPRQENTRNRRAFASCSGPLTPRRQTASTGFWRKAEPCRYLLGRLLGAPVRYGRWQIRDPVVDKLREACGVRTQVTILLLATGSTGQPCSPIFLHPC